MIKYFDEGVELSEEDVYHLVQLHGTVILDDLKQIEYSDCCNAVLDTRLRYRRPIKICSNCKKDIKKKWHIESIKKNKNA